MIERIIIGIGMKLNITQLIPDPEMRFWIAGCFALFGFVFTPWCWYKTITTKRCYWFGPFVSIACWIVAIWIQELWKNW